jgi:putative nucleotidyltransferase with HDIG domain
MEEVFDLYTKYGNKGYIGENVTQYEHAVQCALLGEQHINKVTTDIISKRNFILACFFHDVGHLMEHDKELYETYNCEKMGDVGIESHEKKGAQYLRDLNIHKDICLLVENHINVKRYLVTMNSEYYEKLSDASKESFKYQGGKMTESEIKGFQKDNLYIYHLMLRKFDDAAKSSDPELISNIANYDYINYFKKLI